MLDAEAIRSLLRAGEYTRLIAIVEALPAVDRDATPVQLALGLSLLRLGHHEEADRTARRLIECDPHITDAYTLRAAALRAMGDLAAAFAVLRSAVALHPGQAAFWRILGEVRDLLPADDRPTRRTILARAHAAAPGDTQVRRAYALALAQASGEARFAIAPETALAVAERAIRVDPGCGEARSAKLFARQCLDTQPSDSMLQDAVDAAAAHAHGIVARHPTAPRRAGPLRIGFLACGLAYSSVRHFMAGLFAHHDPAAVSISLYDHCPATDDDYARLTDRIRVVDVAALANPELADRIAADAIDVLVDLVGHGWYGRRLGVMARRPAPVQIAYCGYLGTLGLPAVDWFFSDSAIHPSDGRERYVERLLPLPNWICYAPPATAPAIALRSDGGPVVFGSFNQLGKVSPDCLKLWRAVLDAVPDCRLLVKRQDLRGYEREFRERMRAHGLPVERVDLDARTDPHRDHLAAYAGIDVALDTYPYSGATTACEALWMGVPVVALSGATAVSRMSRSILRAASLEHWCSDDIASAVAVARTLADDRAGRQRFRAEARDRLTASPLCDAPAFSRAFEAACRSTTGA